MYICLYIYSYIYIYIYIYSVFVWVSCGQIGVECWFSGLAAVSEIMNVYYFSFCRCCRGSFFSSPDGEVTGKRSWSSRRRESAFSDERRGDAVCIIYYIRYVLLELIYISRNCWLTRFFICILAFSLKMIILRFCPHDVQ